MAFGMSIGRGGWQWKSIFQAETGRREYTGSALFMEKGFPGEEQDMCRAIVV